MAILSVVEYLHSLCTTISELARHFHSKSCTTFLTPPTLQASWKHRSRYIAYLQYHTQQRVHITTYIAHASTARWRSPMGITCLSRSTWTRLVKRTSPSQLSGPSSCLWASPSSFLSETYSSYVYGMCLLQSAPLRHSTFIGFFVW